MNVNVNVNVNVNHDSCKVVPMEYRVIYNMFVHRMSSPMNKIRYWIGPPHCIGVHDETAWMPLMTMTLIVQQWTLCIVPPAFESHGWHSPENSGGSRVLGPHCTAVAVVRVRHCSFFIFWNCI